MAFSQRLRDPTTQNGPRVEGLSTFCDGVVCLAGNYSLGNQRFWGDLATRWFVAGTLPKASG